MGSERRDDDDEPIERASDHRGTHHRRGARAQHPPELHREQPVGSHGARRDTNRPTATDGELVGHFSSARARQ